MLVFLPCFPLNVFDFIRKACTSCFQFALQIQSIFFLGYNYLKVSTVISVVLYLSVIFVLERFGSHKGLAILCASQMLCLRKF